MKIYILRHEDRTQDCSFFAPLTETGLENSVKLVQFLKRENINKIYTSPFIRTLQTIYPYVKTSNLTVNIEYGLSEIYNEEIIPKKAVGIHLPKYLADSFKSNSKYVSIVKPNEIVFPEREVHLNQRVKKVLREIISSNCQLKSDTNILIVTHQAICCSILEIVTNATSPGKLHTPIQIYPKGQLTQVFDSNKNPIHWTNIPINKNPSQEIL
jgi:broad specificity phosphatase PhoE